MLENTWKFLPFLMLNFFQSGNAQNFSHSPSLSRFKEIQLDLLTLEKENELEYLSEAADLSRTTASSDAFVWMETESNKSLDSNADEKFEKESNKYWSVRKARKAVIGQDGDYGAELRNIIKSGSYKFENGTYKTTDKKQIEYNWKNDHKDFGSCCQLAANDLRIVVEFSETLGNKSNDGNGSVNADVAKKISDLETKIKIHKERVESFIELVIKFVKETIPFDENAKEYAMIGKWKNTWKNWFQLSIMFPNVLAYYMMVPYKIRKIPSEIIIKNILKIIPTPYRSLSYEREGANAVSMFGPWLIARIYDLGCDEKMYEKKIIYGSKVYKTVLNELALHYKVNRFAAGIHRDGTYISHETVLGFGYLKMMCSIYTMYVYSFDKNLASKPTPQKHWKRVSSLLLHPNIYCGPPGILDRGNSFGSTSDPKAPLGGKIMPLARILRVNTPKCRFFARGVTSGLGFFEADHSSDLYSQYWVQSRIPYSAKSDIQIPEFKHAYGLIFSSDHDDYIRLKSRTQTTDIYWPANDSWSIVGSLGSTKQTRQDFLLQNYAIEYYGKYRVYEYIRYSHQDEIYVVIDLEIDNRKGDKELGIRYSSVDVNPHKTKQTNHKLQVLKIPIGIIARLQHIVNLENCTIRTILEENQLRNPMWPDFDARKTILPLSSENRVDKWILNTEDNVVSSSVSGVHSCAAPLPNEKEEESIRNNTFVFDAEDRNMYMYNKKVGV